jgi:hypothetical protein
MKIVMTDEQEKADTGIIARVFPFDLTMPSYSIVVRRYCIDLEGSALLDPQYARVFARSIQIAADIAEGNYEIHKELITETTKRFFIPRHSFEGD